MYFFRLKKKSLSPHVTSVSLPLIKTISHFFMQSLIQTMQNEVVSQFRPHAKSSPPLKNSILTSILTFLNLDFSAKCPFLAFKCHPDAFLVKYYFTGCLGCPTDGESGPWGKDATPGLKMSPTMPKTDSRSFFNYILKFSI